MARRTFWKGYLKLSLVTCPVAMVPATSESERLLFHTLNRKTGHRVASRYIDSGTGKPVDEDDEVKGYEKGDIDYVVLEDDELEAVALESTRTIDIVTFVPADSIGWVYYDKAHYLTPDDEVGTEAFAVIRDAMAASGMVGISRLVMYRRERAVMLQPRDEGIILWTLREGGQIREPEAYFEKAGRAKPDPKLLTLVKSLIDERTRDWDPSMASDPVQEKLLDIISAKKKGATRPARRKEEAPEPPSNVINIMDALKRSLAAEGGGKGGGKGGKAGKRG